MKAHISGGWRPTWWLSIRFKRNTERAQNFTNYFWEPLTWPGDAEVACIYDVHKCSRASFSREHQTGILFFELIFSKQNYLKDFVLLQFWPRSVPKIPRRVRWRGHNSPAQNDLLFNQNGQKCNITRVCALNVILPPRRGGSREPGSRRVTVR